MLAALALMLGGVGQARAGLIPLPTTLDQLLPVGNFTQVSPVPYTFANFGYSTSPVGSPPASTGIQVTAFQNGAENGITANGGFSAAAGSIVDYAITYTVTAPSGLNITDALLSGSFDTHTGTGSASVVESIIFANGTSTSLDISTPPGSASSTIRFFGVNSITVEEDILTNGGSNGVTVSIVNNGFSTPGFTSVPEPSTLTLLGIGSLSLLGYGWRRRKQVLA
jgi:hypothetical protein